MTGHNHLRQQRERCGRFAGYCLLVLIPSWLAMLALDNSWLTRSVIALSLLLIIAVVVAFPPRCPSCRKLLALTWKGAPIHRFCPHCGADFASERVTTAAPTHQRALTPDP